MKWLKKIKIGTKLFLGFSVMILFMGAIGFTGYMSTGNIQQQIDEIFNIRLPSIDFLIEADRDLQQLLVAERSMIFANAKSDLFQELVADYEENLKQADVRWEKFKVLATTSSEREVIPKYEQTREEWKVISRKVVDGRIKDTRQGRREALDLSLGLAKEKFENMRVYLDNLTGTNLNIAKEAHEAATATYRKTVINLLSISGVGLIIGILLMWINNRGVTRPLRRVIEGLTEALWQELHGSGIRVLLIEPGDVRTEIWDRSQHLLEEDSPYLDALVRFHAVKKKDMGDSADPPARVAARIADIIESDTKTLRHPVAKKAGFFLLARKLLPDPIFLWAVRRSYQIEK